MIRKLQAFAAFTAVMVILAASGCSGSSGSGAAPTPAATVIAATATPTTPSEYAEATRQIVSDYGVAFRRLGTLMSNPLFDNQTWRQNSFDTFANIQAIGARLRALTPPACLNEVHAAQLEAASSYERTVDLLLGALQSGDDDALQESADSLGAGNEALSRAVSLLSTARC